MQEFPADLPGQYLNNVDFGLVKAKLLGNYNKSGLRVNLVFLWTEFSCGPFKFKKVSFMHLLLRVRLRAANSCVPGIQESTFVGVPPDLPGTQECCKAWHANFYRSSRRASRGTGT